MSTDFKCNDGNEHDFDSNTESEYCAKGCGEKWAIYAIKKLGADLKEKDAEIGQLKASYDELKKQLSVDFQYQTIEQLKADLKIVRETLEGQRAINDRQYGIHAKEVQQLKSKLEIAKKGLEFYADGDGDVLDWSGVNKSAYIQVKGKRAKQTLLEIEDAK